MNLLIRAEFVVDSKSTSWESFRTTSNFSAEDKDISIADNHWRVLRELDIVQIGSVHRTNILDCNGLYDISIARKTGGFLTYHILIVKFHLCMIAGHNGAVEPSIVNST